MTNTQLIIFIGIIIVSLISIYGKNPFKKRKQHINS